MPLYIFPYDFLYYFSGVKIICVGYLKIRRRWWFNWHGKLSGIGVYGKWLWMTYSILEKKIRVILQTWSKGQHYITTLKAYILLKEYSIPQSVNFKVQILRIFSSEKNRFLVPKKCFSIANNIRNEWLIFSYNISYILQFWLPIDT